MPNLDTPQTTTVYNRTARGLTYTLYVYVYNIMYMYMYVHVGTRYNKQDFYTCTIVLMYMYMHIIHNIRTSTTTVMEKN